MWGVSAQIVERENIIVKVYAPYFTKMLGIKGTNQTRDYIYYLVLGQTFIKNLKCLFIFLFTLQIYF